MSGLEREIGRDLVKDKKVDYKFDNLQYLSVSMKIMKKKELGSKCNNCKGKRNTVQPVITTPVNTTPRL
jgi:hypothetical protein